MHRVKLVGRAMNAVNYISQSVLEAHDLDLREGVISEKLGSGSDQLSGVVIGGWGVLNMHGPVTTCVPRWQNISEDSLAISMAILAAPYAVLQPNALWPRFIGRITSWIARRGTDRQCDDTRRSGKRPQIFVFRVGCYQFPLYR